MAIEVSGTTIIDNYKFLTNIGGYSGHRAGKYIRATTGGFSTDFKISNIFQGKARFIVSGHADYPGENFYAVYDVFGNLNANSIDFYNFKTVAEVVASSGYSYFAPSKTNTAFEVRGKGAFNQTIQYIYTWDLYYNIGSHTSVPTLTIVNV